MQNQWSIPIFWDGSYRIGLFFQSVCSLTTFTPYDKTETAQRLKVPPPHLYHTKILGYIRSNAHKPDRPHNQRTIHDQQHISEKSVLHSFQTSRYRKRHSHTLPRYNPDCTISAQITTYQRTIHPTADKNHITLSCQRRSQYKSQSPT